MVPSSLSEPALHRLRVAFQRKSLYDEMRKGMASDSNAFKVEREDGAKMGPWKWPSESPSVSRPWWLT
jgi:4-carboxymuconolactone decarboxylase